jgi:hypothetical protein
MGLRPSGGNVGKARYSLPARGAGRAADRNKKTQPFNRRRDAGGRRIGPSSIVV